MRSAIANHSKKTGMQTPQRGMALIAALFLIVVLASLGMFAVRIGGAQQQTVNLGLLGDRAVAAANSGIEYGAFRAVVQGNCANWPAFNLNQAALAGLRVEVRCVALGGGNFDITSFASNGAYGSPDYVSRTVTRTVP